MGARSRSATRRYLEELASTSVRCARGPTSCALQRTDGDVRRRRRCGRRLVGVADPVKPTTREAIEALHREGVQSRHADRRQSHDRGGGRQSRAASTTIEADVLPDQKAAVVKRLQQRRASVVAMAGDGINDAPALAQADVGIAMGTGTDVAMESAGVTLVKGDLRGIVRARRLSRGDDEEHPAESVLCVRLQRARRADRRRRAVSGVRMAAQPDDRERGDDLQLGLGDRQRATASKNRSLGSWIRRVRRDYYDTHDPHDPTQRFEVVRS